MMDGMGQGRPENKAPSAVTSLSVRHNHYRPWQFGHQEKTKKRTLEVISQDSRVSQAGAPRSSKQAHERQGDGSAGEHGYSFEGDKIEKCMYLSLATYKLIPIILLLSFTLYTAAQETALLPEARKNSRLPETTHTRPWNKGLLSEQVSPSL